MDISRRSVLRTAGVTLGVGVVGCIGTRPFAGSAEISKLDLRADVVAQPSAESPARIAARLENARSRPARVEYGTTLLVSDDTLEWPSEIVLEWDDDPRMTCEDGCWRRSTPATKTVRSIANQIQIAPGEALTQEYYVLSRYSGPCLPVGTYRFRDVNAYGESRREMVLTLVVEIDENGAVSARGNGPESKES